ncbi:hypothetical protein [Cellulomonas sp. URHD0024]|uniref:hypothetical protein n=1 Tax=Cellulomonas sp. URHD0024 TaxID=1302620 RepID=UPI0004073EEA|nr:hypothetical protein [Cellulomonas sp. URHD0024]
MDDPTTGRTERVLVIGRSPGVILDAVDILRRTGFRADATNQFDDVLADYDPADLDVVVFGGMVPPGTKQYLRDQISTVNDSVTFVQGLAGIPGLIARQVEGATGNGDGGAAYDPATRTVRLVLGEPAQVVVDAWWATSLTPPEPTSTSMRVVDSRFDAGTSVVQVPDEVPAVASFLTVSVGPAVSAFTVGPLPGAVSRMVPTRATALPPVRAVSTHHDD